jgi:hypothetical protein
MKQLTPPCDEHVPLRFCEQLYVWSLQIAVAVPHDAEIDDVTVQMFEPPGGVGLGVGVGTGVGVGVGVGVGLGVGVGVGDGATRVSTKSCRVLPTTATVIELVT